MSDTIEAQVPAAPHSPPGVSRASAYAWYALGLLTLIYVISVIDRQILSILANDIKRDLAIDDASLGFLYGTAFAAFYAVFGIPLGRLADNWHRGRLLAIGLVVWSLMTVGSGLATSFAALAIARIGVGIGEATSAPASYALISEYFPAKRRATAMSIYASGLYLGFGVSLLIGGFISSRWNAAFPSAGDAPLALVGWQAAFVGVGIPGLIVAIWAYTLRDPKYYSGVADRTAPGVTRTAAGSAAWREFARDVAAILPPLTLLSAARYPGELARNLLLLAIVGVGVAGLWWATGDLAQWIAFGVAVYAITSWTRTLKYRDEVTYQAIWANRMMLTLIPAFGSIAFVSFATTFFAPVYALRTFYAGAGARGELLPMLSAAEEVGLIVGTGSAIGSAVGVIAGGALADWWRARNPAGRLYAVIVAVVVSAPMIWFMFLTPSLRVFFLVGPLAVAIGSSWSGAAIATVQDLVPPAIRASAGAAFILGITIVGLALGPYIAGKIGAVTGDIRTGVLAIYLITPATLIALWWCARNLATAEVRLASH